MSAAAAIARGENPFRIELLLQQQNCGIFMITLIRITTSDHNMPGFRRPAGSDNFKYL
jgi:hypothetical protein